MAGILGVLLLFLAFWVWRYQRYRQVKQGQFLRQFDFAALLDARVAQRHPSLTAEERVLLFEGLRDWFKIARMAGLKPISMPSQGVDDAWHELILFTRNYQAFCQQAFGRFLHHIPSEAMRSPTQAQEGIRRSWVLACRLEGIDPNRPSKLPRIFALDAQLQVANGFVYTLDCASPSRGSAHAYCASHIGGGCSGSSCGSCSTAGEHTAGHTGDSSSCGSGCGGSGCGGGGD